MKKAGKARKIIKTTALSLLGVILTVLIVAGIVLYGRIATAMSLKKVGDQLYTLNYKQNYHLDKAIASNIKTEAELLNFICDEFYFGCKVDTNVKNFACSAFITDTPDGKKLAGRNFDYAEAETLSVYTDPGDGYASISSVDLDVMKIGEPNSTPVMSTEGRIAVLAAPYLCVDGVNEMGLNVSILDTDKIKLRPNNDKPILLIPIAVRMLLDRAANVDEAVEMLEKYDIQCSDSCTQHLFLSDKSGKAVTVEWTSSKMKVTEYPVCTNFELFKAKGEYEGICDRFDSIVQNLERRPQNNAEEAMEILKSASVSWTQWSCVFNLSDFSADYVIDRGFNNVYHLTPEDY